VSRLVRRLSDEEHTSLRSKKKRIDDPDWRERLWWAYVHSTGTVLSAVSVKDLVDEFDAMCAERSEILKRRKKR